MDTLTPYRAIELTQRSRDAAAWITRAGAIALVILAAVFLIRGTPMVQFVRPALIMIASLGVLLMIANAFAARQASQVRTVIEILHQVRREI